jgi:hypothetical protein
MTDTLEAAEAVAVAPRPVRRPPPRRSTTPPRQAPASQPDPVLNRLDQILAQQSDFAARLEVVEKGGIRFIESEEPPKPIMREANPESASPFTQRLLAHTHDMPEGGVTPREPRENVPLRWYLRRDGDFVQLQGDANNRALYQDLGFYCLTLEEAADYAKHERPGILREQHTRAALINGLRQLVKREAILSGYIDDFKWDEGLAEMSIDRLEEEWHNLCGQTANPKRRLPTAERHRQETDAHLVGVETTASREDLLRKMSAPGAQTRTIEVTRENAHMFS